MAGRISGPFLKGEDKYLTNPVWVGDAVPGSYMAWPWGLGGECWWVRAEQLSATGTVRMRRVFAGMDQDSVLREARAWLAAGAPTARTLLT